MIPRNASTRAHLGSRLGRSNAATDADGQVLQEWNRTSNSTLATKAGLTQYVWGVGYVNDLVLRDRDADGNTGTGNLGLSGSGMEERLYAQNDANHNLTSMANTSATVVAREVYDPYGNDEVIDAIFGPELLHRSYLDPESVT